MSKSVVSGKKSASKKAALSVRNRSPLQSSYDRLVNDAVSEVVANMKVAGFSDKHLRELVEFGIRDHMSNAYDMGFDDGRDEGRDVNGDAFRDETIVELKSL